MDTIETLMQEKRSFTPPTEFSQKAQMGDLRLYEQLMTQAAANPVHFWEKAAENIHWFQKWHTPLKWNQAQGDEVLAQWFVGGTTNASYNCLDRHLAQSGEKLAIIWEGEDGTVVRLTYRELHRQVCQLANAMEKDLGLKAGDTAAIYLPLIPEAIITMLACARLGITHTVIFAGFSQNAIRDRVLDAECKVIFTADIAWRRGQALHLKSTVDQAVKETPSVEAVIVLCRQVGTKLTDLDRDWHSLLKSQSPEHTAQPLPASHPLFILYTSGTTGKPKGIVHGTGGYLVGVNCTTQWVLDLKPNDIYWCTADIGWITGHSYIVYGILSLGMTNLIYEGAINYPQPDRMWSMIDRHKVTVLYTAPTAIRSFMRSGNAPKDHFQLQSLRLLGSVGEPINPEAWMWYHSNVGRSQCPIVDTWWQTETGAIMISPLPGVTTLKPGSATRPFPGILADIVDESGKSCSPNQGGYLVIRHPWPAMMQTIHKDPKRVKEQYWSKFPGMYFTGDGAHRDEQGYFWIKGRVDDVINVSGHRLGTMEIESALVSHPWVSEAAVVGRPDELKGQAVVAFVIPKESANTELPEAIVDALKQHVVAEIGSIARPDEIRLTRTLPKTRSGKIMRRLLKDLAAGKAASGDTSTLENADLVDFIDGK